MNLWGLPRDGQWQTLERIRVQKWRHQHQLHRLELVLRATDSTEYTQAEQQAYQGQQAYQRGCLPSMFIRKRPSLPEYAPGQTIRGYLLVHPATRITITGLQLVFGGKYTVNWEDEDGTWGGYEPIYSQRLNILPRNTCDLPSKPHRFEFSYTLPDYLPPVIHEHEVSTCYYVYATLLQDDAPESVEPIESLDFYFSVHSTLDIARVPSVLQDGAEFSRLWEFQLRTPLPANSSATTGVVCVRMTLHRRTFLIGGNFIVDVSLWNHLNAPVNCKLKFIRVLTFYADHGTSYVRLNQSDMTSPDYSSTRRRQLPRELAPPVRIRVGAEKNQTFSKMYDIPEGYPSTARVVRDGVRHDDGSSFKKMPVKVDYQLELSARPTWASIKPMVLRVGLVIGTEDSRTDSHISATSGALPGSLALEMAEGETANEETTSESKPFDDSAPPSYEDCV